MKRVWSLALAFAMIFSLAACGEKPAEPSKEAEKAGNEQEQEQDNSSADADASENEAEGEKVIKLGLVTDTGGIDDNSFNQSTWEGIERFCADKGIDAEENAVYLQSSAEADYIPNLSTYADEKLDLIVAPGFYFTAAMDEVAKKYPEQKFLLIDSVLEEAKDNVVCAVFSENEGSYLVGVVTALKAKEADKKKVGFMGGKEFGVIHKFEAGFEAGVKAVDPEMEIMVEYVDAFDNEGKAQTIASKMYDDGCYVIFHAAGGSGGGLIKEAQDRVKNGEDVWACGVDKDQYANGVYDEENNKSVVLTSMMKKVDVAAYDVSESVLNDEFKGGEVLLFNLENEGVGLPAENPNLKDEWVQEADEYAKKIISGEVKVPEKPSRLAE